ncbi:MAG TPA: glycosyltransferase family 2 protein, partial [Roseiflexaceae bacterium]
MSSEKPDVSIILVSWNTRDLLLACLASLPAALGGLHADVWVVDNGSADGSVAAVRERYSAARLIENGGNPGFAAANNQAIDASAGRYALLLNSDTVATPGSIERLVRFADEHPLAGIVGARLLNPDGSFQASFADFPSLRSELLSVTGLGPRLFGRWY